MCEWSRVISDAWIVLSCLSVRDAPELCPCPHGCLGPWQSEGYGRSFLWNQREVKGLKAEHIHRWVLDEGIPRPVEWLVLMQVFRSKGASKLIFKFSLAQCWSSLHSNERILGVEMMLSGKWFYNALSETVLLDGNFAPWLEFHTVTLGFCCYLPLPW